MDDEDFVSQFCLRESQYDFQESGCLRGISAELELAKQGQTVLLNRKDRAKSCWLRSLANVLQTAESSFESKITDVEDSIEDMTIDEEFPSTGAEGKTSNECCSWTNNCQPPSSSVSSQGTMVPWFGTTSENGRRTADSVVSPTNPSKRLRLESSDGANIMMDAVEVEVGSYGTYGGRSGGYILGNGCRIGDTMPGKENSWGLHDERMTED